ncbi:DNA polymerase I [Bacillota bacterium LX-D]|nr:DNA polymerase I [Bacillota bacterium LX-D]
MKPKEKILILDGNSLAHRAFYALPLLSNRQGIFTNAAYGFTMMLLKLLKTEKPGYIVVAFDKGKTFRHEQYSEYKGRRKATPQELRPQFIVIRKILKALNIAIVELEGFEADDLLGTIANKAEQENLESIIITGDRDALQLVTEHTNAYITRKGISVLECYDKEAIVAKYGIEPPKLRDVKGLMGDNSDNIPGIPGIGEKTAVQLIQEYGSVENLLANVEKIKKPKLKENIINNKEQALFSKKLGTIDCCVPLRVDFSDYRYEKPDYPALLEIFTELEFNSLLKEILSEIKDQTLDTAEFEENDYFVCINTISELKTKLANVPAQKVACYFAFDSKDYLKAKITAIGMAWGSENVYLDFRNLSSEEINEYLSCIFDQENREVICYDLKAIFAANKIRGISFQASSWDILLAAYLLNPSASNYELENLSLEYLNKPLVPSDQIAEIVTRSARSILNLKDIFTEKLVETEMEQLYSTVELPLIKILAKMEIEGVKLDKNQLLKMGQEIGQEIDFLTDKIYQLAGEEFNINSPKQLGVILFEKLGLPPLKKTKTGYSTNAEVLEELAERHEIVANILEYRQLVKLKSTYIDGLLGLISPNTERVHTTFNQTVTATGRLSSTEPNLQNIPIRLEVGRRLRKAFIPSSPENVLLAADYSQIELRVLASIAQDASLIDAFLKNQDIHTRTASEVFGIPMDEVTKDLRRRAKAVNFGIVYGISDFGLSKDLSITRKEAQNYIDLYFSRYPSVKKYIEQIILEAREKGYVTTILKRRRYLPDIYSSNRNVRAFGERTAMNTPIQGSAADIIKLAMLEVDKRLQEAHLKTKMILQVHDELIFDVPKEEMEEVPSIVRSSMENVYSLDVPLKVDMKYGPNWYDMTEL